MQHVASRGALPSFFKSTLRTQAAVCESHPDFAGYSPSPDHPDFAGYRRCEWELEPAAALAAVGGTNMASGAGS